MESNRLELHELLGNVMEQCQEEPKLFFQPPPTVKLSYPCMVYHLRTLTSWYADNVPYKTNIGFDVTYITRSPVSKVPAALAKLPQFGFDRYYESDNLHHYAYTAITTLKE